MEINSIEDFVNNCNVTVIDYEEIEWHNYIGKGSSGQVYKAKVLGKEVIGKCFELANYYSLDRLIDSISGELSNYDYLVGTKNCCELLGISYSKKENGIYLLLRDYKVVGDLHDYINQDKFWNKLTWNKTNKKRYQNEYYYRYKKDEWLYRMERELKIKITHQLCCAIKEIHDRNLVHCDLKLNNMLYVEEENKIILLDFDASYYLGDNYYDYIDEGMGTYGYTCKELNDGYCCKKSDIYSLAVCILEVWCGGIWNTAETIKECRLEVLSSLRKLEKKEPKLGKILRSCLVLETDKRPYIDTVIKNIYNLEIL